MKVAMGIHSPANEQGKRPWQAERPETEQRQAGIASSRMPLLHPEDCTLLEPSPSKGGCHSGRRWQSDRGAEAMWMLFLSSEQ